MVQKAELDDLLRSLPTVTGHIKVQIPYCISRGLGYLKKIVSVGSTKDTPIKNNLMCLLVFIDFDCNPIHTDPGVEPFETGIYCSKQESTRTAL